MGSIRTHKDKVNTYIKATGYGNLPTYNDPDGCC